MDSKAAEGICTEEDAVITLGKMRLIYKELRDSESANMCLRMIVTRHSLTDAAYMEETLKAGRGKDLSDLIIGNI